MNVVTFNTGRQYTTEGQIITAAVQEDGSILFNDHSRGIWGKLAHNEEDYCDSWKSFQEFVLWSYDLGGYEHSDAASQLTLTKRISEL